MAIYIYILLHGKMKIKNIVDSVYVTMSISAGLYPNSDLQNANKLYYITMNYEKSQIITNNSNTA